jgi:hypothetical protein
VSFGQEKSTSIKRIIERNNLLSGSILDQATMFKNSYIMDDNFYYEYSMNNCKSDQTEFQNKVFEKIASNMLKNNINSIEEYIIIGDNGYNIIFKYKCDDGRSITEINFEFTNGKFKYKREESKWNETVDLMFNKLNTQN